MPPNTVKVDRTTRWGNPFRIDISNGIDAATAVELYRRANVDASNIKRIRNELAGKNLACWCPLWDKNGLRVPCHADVLLDLANL